MAEKKVKFFDMTDKEVYKFMDDCVCHTEGNHPYNDKA